MREDSQLRVRIGSALVLALLVGGRASAGFVELDEFRTPSQQTDETSSLGPMIFQDLAGDPAFRVRKPPGASSVDPVPTLGVAEPSTFIAAGTAILLGLGISGRRRSYLYGSRKK